MRSYHRQGRKTARRWLRWLSAGRVQADDLRVTWALWAIAAAIVLSTVATPAQAQTTVRCRWPWQPAKVRMASGRYGWTCIYVPQTWQSAK